MKAINHIYIHVPFCSGKCLYCGFHSKIYNKDAAKKYLDALEWEIKSSVSKYNISPKTIYMGGGTPSLLTAPQLNRLFQILQRHIDLDEITEWTLEGNPGTFTDDKIAILKEYGITRISLGAQSMDNRILTNMERRHTAEQTIQTVRKLQSAGFKNIGLDLIACLPGVSPETWQNTLKEIINLTPQHISVYALSIDPNSKLHEMQNLPVKPFSPVTPVEGEARRRKPEQQALASATHRDPQPPVPSPQPLPFLPTPEQEQSALTTAETKLIAAGYNHYEISNYAKPNHQCKHNTAIWKGADYIGFGSAAASRVGLCRWENPVSEPRGWKPEARDQKSETRDQRPATKDHSQLPTVHSPHSALSPETDAVERFMFTFRLYKGINPVTFTNNHGQAAKNLLPYWLKQLAILEKEGLVINNSETWSLTTKGRNYADTVAESMLP